MQLCETRLFSSLRSGRRRWELTGTRACKRIRGRRCRAAWLILHCMRIIHGRKDVLLEVEWTHAGQTVRLRQETTFPESDQTALHLTLESPAEFALRIRMPSWSEDASVMVNGEQFTVKMEPNTWGTLRRRWQTGDVVTVRFLCMRVWCRSIPSILNAWP